MSSPPIINPFAVFCSMLGVWVGHLFATDGNSGTTNISPWWVAPLAPLLMALGGAIQWAVGERRKSKELAEKKAADEEATYIKQLESLVERQKQDINDLVKERKSSDDKCDEIERKYNEERISSERKSGYTRYLQSVLKAGNLHFDVWEITAGSPPPPAEEGKS